MGALLLCCRLVELCFHLPPLEMQGFSLEGQLFVSLFWHKNHMVKGETFDFRFSIKETYTVLSVLTA